MASTNKSRGPDIQTVGDRIAWSYANLARADAALRDEAGTYQRIHHMIRAKLFMDDATAPPPTESDRR